MMQLRVLMCIFLLSSFYACTEQESSLNDDSSSYPDENQDSNNQGQNENPDQNEGQDQLPSDPNNQGDSKNTGSCWEDVQVFNNPPGGIGGKYEVARGVYFSYDECNAQPLEQNAVSKYCRNKSCNQ